MTDRPILFSAPMVRALLEGRKTQTRRLAWKDAPMPDDQIGAAMNDAPSAEKFTIEKPTLWQKAKPGDRLWVRETWAHYQTINYVRRSGGRTFSEVSDGLALYRADGHSTIQDAREHIRLMSGLDLEAVEIYGDRWRPSIHMPRWASRLTLVVTETRVERLLDISEDDARAEGFEDGTLNDGWAEPRPITDCPGWAIQAGDTLCSAAGMFLLTWSKLHTDWDGYSSPDVVALSFAVHQKNIDAMGHAP